MSRRDLLKVSASAAAGLAASSIVPGAAANPIGIPKRGKAEARIRFGVIGMNHGHVYGQTNAVIRGGGELAAYFAPEPQLASQFGRRYPDARLAESEQEILEDPSIQLIVSAYIPDMRAPLGIRAMQHGKDYLSDKPGITTLDQLADVRRTIAETNRIYSILYSERLEVPAAVKAGELIMAGAIGDVVQTVGLGPHRVNAPSRPEWFWDRARYGGIICDIGAHQVDQFLFYTGSDRAEVVASQVGNFNHKDHPQFEDFGDVMLRGNGGTGYIRVDWFTPDGLPTWGDGRLTVIGTEGYIELRKYVDIAGRPGGNHLFIADGDGVRYMDCNDVPLPFGEQFVDDILNRTETAMSQQHCLLATELALKAQAQADWAT